MVDIDVIVVAFVGRWPMLLIRLTFMLLHTLSLLLNEVLLLLLVFILVRSVVVISNTSSVSDWCYFVYGSSCILCCRLIMCG